LPLSSLENFTRRIFQSGTDENVSRYHLSYSEAETVGPALLTYVTLAKALKLRYLYVSANTMREGVLHSIILPESWAIEFQDQVLNSAVELGKKYDFDRSHAEFVTGVCMRLFRELQPLHDLAPRYGLVLQTAALLHEVGLFISGRRHHKHSMYLILNSGLFGLGGHDLLVTALVARYHRKAIPNSSHMEYMQLPRQSRIAVSKMAALLRVADVFDSSGAQRIRDFDIVLEESEVIISIRNLEDITLESLALKANDDLFKRIFGKDIILKRN
jgi:exopolyphosphatase/guanosine-5'-triphosphate,3'-diphosphate pyrophosphatase